MASPQRRLPSLRAALLMALSAAVASSGCSGGGGSSSGSGTDTSFQMTRMSVAENAVWPVNREIEFEFSAPLDFSSVSLNTIHIQAEGGAPATGTFSMDGDRTVVFQPSCPTLPDFSDAGLETGGVRYQISVPGTNNGATNTLRSVSGQPLEIAQVRNFETPTSLLQDDVFQDPVLGPPRPVIRPVGAAGTEGYSYVELGGDPDERVYFEVDDQGQLSLFPAAAELPLNLYSDPASRLAVILELNQPVSPLESNFTQERLQLEFQGASGDWQPLATRIELLANCTSTGSSVRLEPIGVVPAGTRIRPVVRRGFQDLTGESNPLDLEDFAVAPTRTVAYPSLDPARLDELADEVFEPFDFGADEEGSLLDDDALFETPGAIWADGRLTSGFAFDGAGGPNGDFDWIIGAGEQVFFDTTSTTLVGGPGGLPTSQQTAIGGFVDVRHLIIEEGGTLRVQGVNPMRLNASGDVIINGTFDLSGFQAKDVVTLGTGNQAEVGGAGAAGGGKGGNASTVLDQSTFQGSPGNGPAGFEEQGGLGGESGYARPTQGSDARRPGGGGGGRFTTDEDVALSENAGREVARSGDDGNERSRGALTRMMPARGGGPGEGPFLDGDPDNNFFGVLALVDGDGNFAGPLRGELTRLWGGYGGGGGGDAIPTTTFPPPNWNPGSDEKGGGGGGAGGGLQIKALGEISFGPVGFIRSNGNRGGTGENTGGLDHVGGTGGSGSGGHIILESAQRIDFTQNGALSGLRPNIALRAVGGPRYVGAFIGGGGKNSAGGQGSAGVIQLHVPNPLNPVGTDPNDPAVDIVVPLAAMGSTNREMLDVVTNPPAYVMIPTFGARSKVRSRWIPIGKADDSGTTTPDLVRFLFGGLDTSLDPQENGKVLTTNGRVNELTPLFDGDLEGSSELLLGADDVSLEVRGSVLEAAFVNGTTRGLSNDLYLRTPALLESFKLRLSNGTLQENFSVASATYDEGTTTPGDESLRLVIAPLGGETLRSAYDRLDPGGTVRVALVPRFFRVLRDGLEDDLPDSAFIRIQFQATGADANGNPDPNVLVDLTSDIESFSQPPVLPGDVQFFRFEVEFDLDAQLTGLTPETQPVSLDFLRVPFVF